MPKNADLKATWIETAVAQRLIEAPEAEWILSAAGTDGCSIEQVVLTRFADDLERLGALQDLLQEMERDAGSPSTSNSDVTETIGPKSRRTSPTKQNPAPPSGTQVLADSQQQDPTLAKGSRLGPNNSTRQTGRSNANKSTQRKSASARPSGGSQPSSQNRFNPQLTQQLEDLRRGSERYQPLDEIGRGGCGVVTQALDLQLQRNVVVKRIIERDGISDEVVQRFINEAQITGQLEHPGIVPIYEVGVDDQGLPYYAMKQVRGVTLADRITGLRSMPKGRDRDVTLRQLIDRFRDVCQTLAFAHQSGVIHRDLKPANIMIGEFGETILLDWGLARRVKTVCEQDSNVQETLQAGRPDSKQASANQLESKQSKSGISKGSAASDMTRQGAVLGTATYMAPEQAQGRNDCVNQQSDVFSLGVILYEILSGESPFRTESLEGTLQRVARCEFHPLREVNPSVPRPLAAICQCAMQADPKARYEDARAMAADLESYLAGGRTSVYREKLWERFDRIANNNSTLFRTIFVGSLLVTTTALVAVGQIMQAHREERYARTVAVDARAQAELALANETSARKRTHEQLIASREAADTWLIDLSGYLEFYPGLGSIRSDLIEQGIHHYKGLLADATSQRSRIRSLAKTSQSRSVDSVQASELRRAETDILDFHLRLGDLFRLSGDATRSLRHYRAAEQAAEHAIDTKVPSDRLQQFEIELSNALIGQAILSIELPIDVSPEAEGSLPSNELARPEAAESTKKAIRLAQAALTENPASQDARSALCRARLVAARLAMNTSDWAGAEQLLYDALPDAEILVQQQPSARFIKLKCSILEDRARVLYRSGQYDKAANSANQLINFYERCLDVSPNRPDLLESRSLAESLLGSCRLAETAIQPAVDAYHRAEDNLEQAWELLYGEKFYRENRAVLAANLSDAYRLAGKQVEADDFLYQAVDELRWLVRYDGVTPDRIYRLSRCYLSLAESCVEQRPEETGEWLKLNRVLIDHLLEQRQPVADLLNLTQLVLEGELAMKEDRIQQAIISLRQALLSHQSQDLQHSEQHSLLLAKAKLFLARIDDSLALDYRSEQRKIALQMIQKVAKGDADLIAHDAFRFLLQHYCESRNEGESDPEKAWVLAQSWASRFPHSPEAWHWLAEAHYLQRQYADADAALSKAIHVRSGESTIEDALLQAAIAFSTDPVSSEHLRDSALRRAAESQSDSLHRAFLIELLNPPTD